MPILGRVPSLAALAAAASASPPEFLARQLLNGTPSLVEGDPPSTVVLGAAQSQFEAFKRAYGRSYSNAGEEGARFARFEATLREAALLNARNNGTPAFGVSFSADFFEEEARAIFSKGLQPASSQAATLAVGRRGGISGRKLGELPDELNWARTKVVTPVKNQGGCGSCWAISVVEGVESMFILYVEEGFQEVFSTQQIASCSEGAWGCGGGHPVDGYKYLNGIANLGLGLAQGVFWPYMQSFTPEGRCDYKNCTAPCGIRDLSEVRTYRHLIGDYAIVTETLLAIPACPPYSPCEKQDLDGMALALAEVGPLSVCVNAMNWQAYQGGVMTREACGGITNEDLDHAVQLVGFNRSAPIPYWIVRNSWTTSWGEHGYIYLEMGQNTCGVANFASYPEVAAGAGNHAADADPWPLGSAAVPRGGGAGFDRFYRQATGAVQISSGQL
jgi:hypothetical protein